MKNKLLTIANLGSTYQADILSNDGGVIVSATDQTRYANPVIWVVPALG